LSTAGLHFEVNTPFEQVLETLARVQGRHLVTMTSGLSTSLEIHDGIARYVVTTGIPVYQERLVHMGYRRSGANSFERAFVASPSVTRIHANFARHLEQMIRQSARLDLVRWEDALTEFLRRAEGTGLKWFLYGSGALAVRGLAVDPADLDFNVSDAQLAGRLFDDLLVEPVLQMSGWVAKWVGRAFYGSLFEWLSDPDPAMDVPEPHEQGLAASLQLETVRWREHSVSVPPLALQLRVAERIGLKDRAAAIRAALDSH
jgi:hypothetical protein